MKANYACFLTAGIVLIMLLYGMTRPKPLSIQLPQRQDQPNILLITVDDLGWADLGCYGADLHETPNIDDLATSGVRFTDAYAAAPICTPTRASLLTGKSPSSLKMTIWREAAKNTLFDQKLVPPDVTANLPLSETTLAEVLKKEGYITAHLGKWHVGDGAHFPEVQGFDINIGATIWGCPPTFFFPYRGEIYQSYRFVPDLERSPDGTYDLSREGEYLTDRLTDEAITIMQKFREEAFLLNLSYYSVHTPIEAKSDLVTYYEEKLEPGLAHMNATYAAMIHSLDENIGRIMEFLHHSGLERNTIIIFLSDNGGFVNTWNGSIVTNNAPLRSGKGSLYEGGIRVPTIIRWPGVTKPGSICEQPISSSDFFPTIMAMANVKLDSRLEDELEGTDLSPLLNNPDLAVHRVLFWHYPHYYPTTTPCSAMREGDWKMIEYLEDGRLELFHLKDDLSEQKNVINEYSPRAKAMQSKLESWRSHVGAPMPKANSDFSH